MLKVVGASDVISKAVKLHKLSKEQLPGGALIVADRDRIPELTGRLKPCRYLDTLSFCRTTHQFEQLGRPPVIIFVTSVPLQDIEIALLTKTGFHKHSQFEAYYVEHSTFVQRTRSFLLRLINGK